MISVTPLALAAAKPSPHCHTCVKPNTASRPLAPAPAPPPGTCSRLLGSGPRAPSLAALRASPVGAAVPEPGEQRGQQPHQQRRPQPGPQPGPGAGLGGREAGSGRLPQHGRAAVTGHGRRWQRARRCPRAAFSRAREGPPPGRDAGLLGGPALPGGPARRGIWGRRRRAEVRWEKVEKPAFCSSPLFSAISPFFFLLSLHSVPVSRLSA